jgi:hypothetical protein
MATRLSFSILDERYALLQLPPRSPIPENCGRFMVTIASREGLSIVCAESVAPSGPKKQGGFCCLEVAGACDVQSVGILSAAVEPLARSQISLFAYSTWETDYILVQEKDLGRAVKALQEAGHTVLPESAP